MYCVVTLSVYPTPGKLKNQPDHGENRTRDLWFAKGRGFDSHRGQADFSVLSFR